MANSRSPRHADEPVLAAVAAAADSLRAQVHAARVAVAVSGGRDSIALLDALCAAGLRPVAALTVDHGLSPHARAWAACAAAHAQRLQVPHYVRSVAVRDADARGIEEAARIARYDALEALCAQCGANVLALAHHQDDLAETVMLQALRGSGPAGLAAMPVLHRGQGGWRWRPLLALPRSEVARYVMRRALPFVHDASNDDTRFARNALRLRVMPAIEQHFPGYRRTLARVASLAAQASAVLDEIARADLSAVAEPHPVLGGTLRWSRWLALSPPRRAQVLRLWLAGFGLRAPAFARLAELQRQLEAAAPSAAVRLRHQHVHVRRWRDWIVVDAHADTGSDTGADADAATEVGKVPGTGLGPACDVGIAGAARAAAGVDTAHTIAWRGEHRIELPALSGVLHIEPELATDRAGLAHERLLASRLVLRLRRGGERIRLAPQAPSRTLKNVFQERGVPAWQRARLPVAYLDEQLLWVAGIGFDARAASVDGRRYGLRWEAID